MIAHMDLRLQNVLLDNDCGVRVCDYGNAVSWQGLDTDTVKAGTIAGTLSRMAPEMLNMSENFSAIKADVWCLGLILFELLTSKPLFDNTDEQDVIAKIIRGDFEPLGLGFSQEARILCSDMLSLNPQERPTCDEILQYEWLCKEEIQPAISQGLIFVDPAPAYGVLKQKFLQCLD